MVVSKLPHEHGMECPKLRKEGGGRDTPMQWDMLFPLSEDALGESGVEEEARVPDVPAEISHCDVSQRTGYILLLSNPYTHSAAPKSSTATTKACSR